MDFGEMEDIFMRRLAQGLLNTWHSRQCIFKTETKTRLSSDGMEQQVGGRLGAAKNEFTYFSTRRSEHCLSLPTCLSQRTAPSCRGEGAVPAAGEARRKVLGREEGRRVGDGLRRRDAGGRRGGRRGRRRCCPFWLVLNCII